jgi:hypothetical protein
MIEDRSCDALAVIFAADFSPAVCPFVVDPGYAANDYQGVGGVANRATSLSSPALSTGAPVGTLPRSHCKTFATEIIPRAELTLTRKAALILKIDCSPIFRILRLVS